MNFQRFNEFLREFQPIIQTVGILVLIVTAGLAYWQIILATRELQIENKTLSNDFDPRWRFEVEYDQANTLIDNVAFSSLNPAINIQSVDVTLLHNLDHFQFNSNSRRFSTNDLKRKIEKIYKSTYELRDDYCYPCTEVKSYPLAIRLHFEKYGVVGDTSIMLDYHFIVYQTKSKIRIKSSSFEFVKYLPLDSASYSRELISYNLLHSFLSDIPEARSRIRVLVGLRDSLYRPIFRYAYSNLRTFQQSLTIVDTEKTPLAEFTFLMPLPLIDSLAIMDRNKIVSMINRNIDVYDSTLINAILRIQRYEMVFYKYKEDLPVDSLHMRPKKQLNAATWKKWRELNYELITLAATRIDI